MTNRPISRLLAAVLLCALAAAPDRARADAVDLFLPATPADTSSAPAAAAPSAGAARERVVAVNAAAIAALPSAPSGAAATELRIALFPGVTAVFPAPSAKPAFGGGSILHAKAGEGDEATLVVAEGRVTGRVLFRGKTYRIRPASGRLHAVAEMSRALLPPVGPEIPSPKSGRSAPPAAAPAEPANAEPTEIDALFVYTKKAKRGSADILAEVNFAVAITNEAYEASGVLMRMRLVGVMQSGTYDEDARDYNGVLADAAGFGPQASAFAATRKQRDKLGADLVVVVREGGEFCGVGYVNGAPADAAAYGYSVTSRWCIVYDTVAHETGHNMGLHHDRYVSGSPPDTEYNFGYVSLPARAMDLMAYENRCWDAGLSCEYKRLFSNPGLTVNGRRFGVPPGRPGAAHGVRWLNEVRGDIKRWRPTRVTAPPSIAVR